MASDQKKDGNNAFDLGAFSLSLAVKDLAVSREFYERLGFSKMGGDAEHGYLIMKSGDTLIGLFQGMFESNILTFNPGWDNNAQPTEAFTDIRDIQKSLKQQSVSFESQADEAG